jgi:hypothetical protein
LRDEIAKLFYLFLEVAAILHTPPCKSQSESEAGSR